MRPNKSPAWMSIVTLVAISGCSSEEPSEPVVRPVISIEVADVDSFRRSTFPGRAKAREEVDLAFEVPGRLVERPVKVGDRLEEGDVVARLDARDYQSALDQALALQGQARSYLDRVEKAATSGAVSRQEVDDARARSDAADAQVRIRRKAVEDTTLVAPFAGTVASTYVENFQNVLAKQTIARLLDASRIEMVVSVPEGLISLASLAYDIEVEFDAYPGRKIPGGDLRDRQRGLPSHPHLPRHRGARPARGHGDQARHGGQADRPGGSSGRRT